MQHTDTNDPTPIFAHITAAGEAAGFTAEALNQLVDCFEQDLPSIYDLPPLDWHRVDDEQTPPSAAQAVRL
ncbi:hypothetical protein [Sulfitobacter sp. 1A12157]|uniref:hypothetical protein n=1 Tax=Sulfitobacter sp. 1A12157 TaxID=3368594 RepID=UPI003745E100